MKHIIYSLLASVILLSSCSKKDSLPADNGKRLVKTTLDIGNNTEYAYDEKGRVIKMLSGDQEVTYAYNGNTILEKQKFVSLGVIYTEITWTLNGKGQAVSGTGSYTMPGQQQQNITVTGAFDDAGYLIRIDIAIGNNTGINEYLYSNGDMVEIKRFNNNSFSGKTKFYYPGQVANKIGMGTGEFQFMPGATTFGKPGAHLPEKVEDINSSGAVIHTLNYTYTLDAQGYPAQKKITGSSNNTQFYYYN
jgi:YD repeat-containing protein